MVKIEASNVELESENGHYVVYDPSNESKFKIMFKRLTNHDKEFFNANRSHYTLRATEENVNKNVFIFDTWEKVLYNLIHIGYITIDELSQELRDKVEALDPNVVKTIDHVEDTEWLDLF